MAGIKTSTIPEETDFRRCSDMEGNWKAVCIRRRLSKRKLRQFFGTSAPVDVSPKDIERFGLPALLQSNVPLCYFLLSMLEQYSAENLFFYLEVESFQCHEFQDPRVQRTTAKDIYRAFIRSGCDLEVNLDGDVKKRIKPAIERNDQHCFDEAKEDIQKLMEPCYMNFLSSDVCKKMHEQLDDKSIPYDETTRETALAHVVEYLDRNLPFVPHLELDPSDPRSETNRRNLLIRKLTHYFAQLRMHLDFYDTEEGLDYKVTPRDILPPNGGDGTSVSTGTPPLPPAALPRDLGEDLISAAGLKK